MTDTLSPQERSERMRLIKSKDTRPELLVRKLCRELGHKGYRLHRKDLPGKPDIAFIGRKAALFVHGCFWHGHDCKSGNRPPKDNTDYWTTKINRNKERDAKAQETLQAMGWNVLVVWECQLKDRETLSDRLERFLGSS
ncbi:very short patch repair endonuclease (plasmid) [Methylocaldum sp. MU1018]|jgi:DNA mismatch endonuclease (patch repair protein)